MYFKKLELVGFKSFCDKTTLNFEPGITAVVGPNGCGKSNIFDSIRWVLGEQSAKSLRGADMLDVIFNGTDNKEPLSMAEVSVTFDNSNRFFNVDLSEVIITRRLFRSGESEYMLNKAVVRLKDIMDLLLGTGIGAESYSIVAQGKIDMVLSSRPEDRRQVFDEASGITKYKAQKREAGRKLDETEQNLLRVNDIVTEVKRQIGSLERQANKARRYREVFEELKIKEVDAAIAEKSSFLKSKEEILNQLALLQEKESSLTQQLHTNEEKIANRQAELKIYEDAMMSLKSEILNLENSLVRNNEHISFNQDQVARLEKNRSVLEEQIIKAKEKLLQDQEQLNKIKEEFNSLKQVKDDLTSILIQKEDEINKLGASIKNTLEEISQSKKMIMDLVARISAAKNEIGEFNSRHQVFLAREKRLEIEKAKVFEEKVIAEDSLQKINQELQLVKTSVEELNKKISDCLLSLGQEGENLNNLNDNIAQAEKEKFNLIAHKDFLEKLRTKYDDIGETLNAEIYLDKLPVENVSGLVVKIKSQDGLSDADKVSHAGGLFKLTGEAKPIELDTCLIDKKIAKLDEDLGELRNKKILRETCISELNKISETLKAELRNQEIALANKESSFATVQEQFNKIKEEEDIIIMELTDIKREIKVLEDNLIEAQNRLQTLSNEQRQNEDKIAQGEEVISVNSRLREDLLVAITQTKTEIDALNKRVASDESTLRILDESFKQDSQSLANFERQFADSFSRVESLNLEILECRKNIDSARKDILDKNAGLALEQEKYNEISNSTVDVVKKINTDREELDTLKLNLHNLALQDKDVEYRYSTIKERMSSVYKVDLGTHETTIASLRSAEGAEAILSSYNNLGMTPEIDLQVLKEEIKKLKEKLDSYGSVNLIAIEEYDELKQRYDFLIQQQTDLVNAKDSLHQAILKINRTTKQMFMETFDKVKVEFKNYFRLLFNGGDAQVFLTDENDPLESGIEIICRPPGKKLQNVLLLSGGEKTMSAIALIFAIFKVKPSPFCILDEIDAALDEANVDRFSRVLHEFAQGSQFIVITHNKKTIANANVMYGITMEQSGVSKIVSVKFSQDKAKEIEKEDKDKDKELEAAAV